MSDQLQKTFADHGLRCTRQRRAIYDALTLNQSHPTADELFQMVKKLDDGMSLATVYNTLEAFCGSGLAYKIAGCGGNGSTRYDAGGDDHMHLRCRKTGRIVDAPHDLGERILEHIPQELINELEDRIGFTVNKVQLDLVGEFKKTPIKS